MATAILAIAWLVANLIELGWARKLAQSLPLIGLIGRNGLLCFIAGAVISLVVDSRHQRLPELSARFARRRLRGHGAPRRRVCDGAGEAPRDAHGRRAASDVAVNLRHAPPWSNPLWMLIA
ncbi:MAG: OpgC protein [uncultured Paraburkholderia sp.]|nr:MAG: OpgC protein [uncultured Paraburkholderia sp.]